jgi:transcriptional regulator
VHARGMLRFLDDAGLHSFLTKLTDTFENNPHSPSLVHKMDEKDVRNMMRAIVAFEIEVTSIEHVFKLSQNRDEKSYENIMHHLAEGDSEAKAVASTMGERKSHVFHK